MSFGRHAHVGACASPPMSPPTSPRASPGPPRRVHSVPHRGHTDDLDQPQGRPFAMTACATGTAVTARTSGRTLPSWPCRFDPGRPLWSEVPGQARPDSVGAIAVSIDWHVEVASHAVKFELWKSHPTFGSSDLDARDREPPSRQLLPWNE